MSQSAEKPARPTVARVSERLWERRGGVHPFVLDGRGKAVSPEARFARRESKRSGEPTATLASAAAPVWSKATLCIARRIAGARTSGHHLMLVARLGADMLTARE